ncbi:Nramp family divalent metal transporter [Conexibacter sp. JD483]|uniref:Nramp family divalent metal transporter n=1 Tax=unclassified Conexibacter TaxID=2627773 RepID=UPI00271D1C92|nr:MULTISPECIES: Nramp family divalent metal transporter [unclassified Conexibacter]MDO8187168.1 Nramp family divalent metal transporter [Conexibacter sp. CPCC 205706]MDO8200344.1 Nramp family divalent metal transporter [Conexibacter sp. CPCC 205762]MDR9368860.1 Nramp family divalent metal transporter [Conexibacter sp. JD483]
MTPPPPPPVATADADAAGPAALTPPSELEQIRARRGLKGIVPLLGPAFVAAIAYVDPGNFATNIDGGASYGFTLLWVIVAANLIGMLIQTLSAKLGLATGKNLPELCRERLPKKASFGLWIQAELIAMATDMAEFIGAAIALNLLFGVPLFVSGLMTAVVAFAILALQSRGYRRFEVAIGGMLAIILLGFLYDTLKVGPDASGVISGLVPGFAGGDSVLLACGILGATVMPHVIYLHSALTQKRIPVANDAERHRLFRFQTVDVVIAMSIAGIVNMLMLIIAASLFHGSALPDLDTLEGAYDGFDTLIGGGAALAFALALLASGFASSSVGTYAGQVIMSGFINRTIPLALRRLVTMSPALIVLALGLDPTRALVISQVVLSFGIPFAVIPLILLTRSRDVMGTLVNRRLTTAIAGTLAAAIVVLNVFLLYQTFFG